MPSTSPIAAGSAANRKRSGNGTDSTHAGAFNRTAYWCFRSPAASRVLYPPLKAARNLLLEMLDRTKVNNLNVPGNDRF